MKKRFSIYFILGFFMLYNCDFKKDKAPVEDNLKMDTINKVSTKENKYSDKAFNVWLDYYKQLNSKFDVSKFKKEKPYKIQREKANIAPIWDVNFNPIYKDFLIYNPDSTQYIDIDSYKWNIDKDKQIHIGADQEVVLVNIPKKKVQRIIFYGPSFWVESAYFKNDSTIVLLENSTDKKPGYQEINLNTDSAQYYIYPESFKNPSEYLKNRILSIYNNNL